MVVKSADFTSLESSKLILIDFGHSREINDYQGEHIAEKTDQPFVGNYAFASHNAFLNKSLSRRDDLISLCYILVFLFDGEPAWIKDLRDLTRNQVYRKVGKVKINMTPHKLCIKG
jgi:hypothetical protein